MRKAILLGMLMGLLTGAGFAQRGARAGAPNAGPIGPSVRAAGPAARIGPNATTISPNAGVHVGPNAITGVSTRPVRPNATTVAPNAQTIDPNARTIAPNAKTTPDAVPVGPRADVSRANAQQN